MDKKRLCILFTGGTIGMVELGNGVRRPPEDPSDFLKIAPLVVDLAEVDFFPVQRSDGSLINKDSMDAVPQDWVDIANAIYQRKDLGYDGFVIVHGVDTMAFTASAIAYAFGTSLNFPIIFVGSQAPATLPHGDGQINLYRACRVALEPLREVAISFNNKVFRACRAQKRDDRDFDAIESPGFQPLCYIKDSVELESHAFIVRKEPVELRMQAQFMDGILTLPITPTTPPGLLRPSMLSDQCNGVILQTLGGGNIPDKPAFNNFIPLIEEVFDAGKSIIITSMTPLRPNEFFVYESGINARNAGAIQMTGMVLPALVTKFSWVLAQLEKTLSPEERKQKVSAMMKSPLVGEVDESRI